MTTVRFSAVRYLRATRWTSCGGHRSDLFGAGVDQTRIVVEQRVLGTAGRLADSVLCTFDTNELRAVSGLFQFPSGNRSVFTFSISSPMASSTSAIGLPGAAMALMRNSPVPQLVPAKPTVFAASSFCGPPVRRDASCAHHRAPC